MKFNLKAGAIVGVSALAMLATAADARHQWRKYAWAWDGTPLAMTIYDNTSGDWGPRVIKASVDWNESKSINGSVVKGSNPQCDFIGGQIHVCNDNYGSNGWLGLASITINGNEITAGWTKLNDYYFDRNPAGSGYNTDIWRQLVTCQEIGHDYGLGHQNENFNSNVTDSCMEYTSTPTEVDMTPDAHDYEQLELMYPTGAGTGDGGGDTGGPPACKGRGCKQGAGFAVGHTPDSWGTPIDFLPNGKPFMYERTLSNGTKIVTHVTWTIEAAAEQGDHHSGPRRHSGEVIFPGGDHDH